MATPARSTSKPRRTDTEVAPQFTPGPWRVDPAFPCDILGADGRDVAETYLSAGYQRERAEREANARLIAAAPELLEACRKLLGSYVAGVGTYALGELAEARELARAAIAKAEGR